ncbi:hypothetical protein [Aminobacter sp. MET-1]|uniref:hypothetical protein n=1 Tax=Aminobacter sp. MET-1 TaxID=2951085 RepID=UPI00226ADDDA|nr:hypothetical protein [Aminobacter sp. MET-1]MCX8571072.1 hypothetical protein [Aminobacter sp. MET-1]MCX8573259.1 hypothetical protein [Aminobacter sp. MET-1]
MSLADALASIEADAVSSAEAAYAGTGWRKAPAQSIVVNDLLPGRSHDEVMQILNAWNSAYHRRVHQLSDDEIKGAERT